MAVATQPAAERPRSRPIPASRCGAVLNGWVRRDGAAALLLLLTLAAEWPLLGGRVVAGLDSLTQYYPWYVLLGDALRAGRVPGWSPHTFAGAPFAANPLSGWSYMPAMAAFTLLPLPAAAVAYQLIHTLLASLGAYVLGRALGLGPVGAVLAGLAYGQSGLMSVNAACCFAFVGVGAWLPVLLAGAEHVVRARDWRQSTPGWSVAALAWSQIVAAWPGQGSYYALLLYAGFTVARVMAHRPRGSRRGRWLRLLNLVARLAVHGVTPLLLGIGLAAAGLLPRAELNALSSLAGGYAPEDLHVGGWWGHDWLQLVTPGYWYVGLSVLALTVVGVAHWRSWPPAAPLLGLGAVLAILATPGPTPLHDLFGLLPGFARLHPHLPDRVMTVVVLLPALLAGAGVERLLAGVARLPAGRAAAPALAALTLALTLLDLRTARDATFAAYRDADSVHTLMSVDLAAYYVPTPAARFLRERLHADGPFRVVEYDPHPDGLAYTQRFADPSMVLLGVNNRAVSDHLLGVQGYDAVHLGRFDAFLRQLNGRSQNYHNADIFPAGLRSPLLALLAVRFVVTPAGVNASGGPAALATAASFGPVYDDGAVRVFENGEAAPWAWLVHDARCASAEEALTLLASGAIDPRRTVLLEPPLRSPLLDGLPWPAAPSRAEDEACPPTWPGDPAGPALHAGSVAAGEPAGRATSLGTAAVAAVTHFEPERLVVETISPASGILVLSEVAYPGWQATVDGAPTPVYVADGLLRAVTVPAGHHVVELRFESASLRLGIIVSLLTATLVAGLLAACFVPRRRTAS